MMMGPRCTTLFDCTRVLNTGGDFVELYRAIHQSCLGKCCFRKYIYIAKIASFLPIDRHTFIVTNDDVITCTHPFHCCIFSSDLKIRIYIHT